MRRPVFPSRPILLAVLVARLAMPAHAASDAEVARAIALERSLAKPADEVRARLELATLLTRLEARAAALKTLEPLEARGIKSPELTAASEAAKKIGPDPDRLDGALAESADALVVGDMKKAGEQFRLAEWFLADDEGKEWSGPWRLYEKRGDKLAQKNRFDLAKADLAKATGRDGKPTPEARIFLGHILRNEGDTRGALAQFDAVGPDAEFAHYRKARLGAAQIHARLYRDSYDVDARTHDIAEAKTVLAIFEELLARNPDDDETRNGRRSFWFDLPARERDRLPAAADLELAVIRDLQERFGSEEALRRTNFLLIARPSFAEAWRLRAKLEDNKDGRELATAVADQLESKSPADAARFPKGVCAPEFHEAVHRRPFDPAPYLARAKVVWEKAKTPAEAAPAERDIRFAKLLDSHDPEVFVFAAAYAATRARLEKYSDFSERDRLKTEAFADADRAVALAPEDAGVLLWRARFSADNDAMRGQKDAIRFCTRALRVNPFRTPARLQRARYEVLESRKTEAEADYRKILADHPDHAEAKQALADLLSGKSDVLTLDAKPMPKKR